MSLLKKYQRHSEKIYTEMAQIEKDFFPALYKERIIKLMRENPKEYGRRLAREAFDKYRKD